MKCDDVELNMLLAQSNELSPKEISEIDAHLAECETCREYQSSLDLFVSVARDVLPSEGPSATTLANIKEAAGRSRIISFKPSSLRFLAYAASVAVILGGWIFVSSIQEPQMSHDINSIIMIVHDSDESVVHDDFEQQTLVDQLLMIEGFELDDTDDSEWLNFEEDPATDLQLHSVPLSQPRKYVQQRQHSPVTSILVQGRLFFDSKTLFLA